MKVKDHRGYIYLRKGYLHGTLLHIEQRRSAKESVFHQRPVQHDVLAGHYCFTSPTI